MSVWRVGEIGIRVARLLSGKESNQELGWIHRDQVKSAASLMTAAQEIKQDLYL